MTKPRSTLISLETTPYYHCIARCVRRAFFFGIDDKGRDLNYRKVAERWLRIYKGPELVRRHVLGEVLVEAERAAVSQIVERWRKRLYDISWFMSCLNYYIALHANKEDGCTGHFWEGRFISQALVDEAALLSCMAYVDLNPVRAGMAKGLEDSDFTSIQERIRQVRRRPNKELPALMPFRETLKESEPAFLPFGLKAYLELVDWSGRARRTDKRGHISKKQPKLLATLGLTSKQWQLLSAEIRKEAATILHGLDKLVEIERRGWLQQAA